MAKLIDKNVLSGELITAEFMNKIIDSINLLSDKVDAVQGQTGSKLKITGVLPLNTQHHLGDIITIAGYNFGNPNSNTLTINYTADNTISNFLPGSSDTMLIFRIPAILGVASTGTSINFKVQGPNGIDAIDIPLFPEAITVLTGTVKFSAAQWPTIPGGNLVPNTYTFVFPLHCSISLDERFTLSASIPTTGWKAWIVDTNNPSSQPGTLDIDLPQSFSPGIDRQISVGVLVPAGSEGTTAYLNVKIISKTNSTINDSIATTLAVSQQTPAPQSIDISRGFVLTTPSTPLPIAKIDSVDAMTLHVPTDSGKKATIVFNAKIKSSITEPPAGTIYTVSATIKPPASVDPNSNKWIITPLQLDTVNINHIGTPDPVFKIQAQPDAPDVRLNIKAIRKDDSTFYGEYEMPLTIKPAI